LSDLQELEKLVFAIPHGTTARSSAEAYLRGLKDGLFKNLLFDLESNGLLHQMDRLHCLVIQDLDTDQFFEFADQPGYVPIAIGIAMLNAAEMLVGHNIIKFDVPAIQLIYPSFKPKGRLLDTLVLARLFWPDLNGSDEALVKRKKMPPKMRGRYSLESFGFRLDCNKGDYSEIMKAKGLDPWAEWNPEMQAYNVQDVVVNRKVYDYAMKCWRGEDQKGWSVPYSDRSVWLEMDVQVILARQERWGFGFNVKAAEELYVELVKKRETLGAKIAESFESWWAPDGPVVVPKSPRAVQRKDFTPIGQKVKKNGDVELLYPKEHYSPDAPYTKIKRVEFNPNSGHHIENRLRTKYNWEPVEFTPSGQAKTDEKTLALLPYPEASVLTEYMTIAKRIGQLAEGKQAWLKKEQKGRIHGTVTTLGAVTRRMTHSNPNLNVPKVKKGDDGNILLMEAGGYGAECRALFTSTAGWVLVGCDADALELRCLAGYMFAYDKGEYIDTVLSGEKSKGTDMHSVNCRALGLDPKKTYLVAGKMIPGRDIAKTWFYAFIYGSGDHNLGQIMGVTGSARAITDAGKKSRNDFLTGLPALGKLTQAVVDRAFGVKDKKTKQWKKPPRGFLVGLDGGKIKVRHRHAALNTLLQSAGAIIMKMALVILDKALQAQGLVPGEDYEFCANVHDEWQIDVRPDHAETVMALAEWSIKEAGVELNFGCPLAGNADRGFNWRDTH